MVTVVQSRYFCIFSGRSTALILFRLCPKGHWARLMAYLPSKIVYSPYSKFAHVHFRSVAMPYARIREKRTGLRF